jgi:hypothetical protein
MKYKKHIQVYEEYSPDKLYEKIPDETFSKEIRDSLSEKLTGIQIEKLINILSEKINKKAILDSIRFSKKYDLIIMVYRHNSNDNRPNNISIFVRPDEYYYVYLNYVEGSPTQAHTGDNYKCDSLEGLLQLIDHILG